MGPSAWDTLAACDDTDNGFGLLFNWNLLDDGEHTGMSVADGEEAGRATVWATTLRAGAEKECLRGAEGERVAEDCPLPVETMTVKGPQKNENGVSTEREEDEPAAETGRPVAGRPVD